ncbi:hypothetical protein BDN72DRAFT_676062 [Pluteus cervinus]|uniref:Uncharacterized protein n=1 Tax=Pluteus cervinus TaxID=181527 RepID=A0ACD2ZZL9_9AGAR|nr:hypothetical protein BDN72DRAFT_676062 [Pluteus cervinus]
MTRNIIQPRVMGTGMPTKRRRQMTLTGSSSKPFMPPSTLGTPPAYGKKNDYSSPSASRTFKNPLQTPPSTQITTSTPSPLSPRPPHQWPSITHNLRGSTTKIDT